MSWIKTAKVGDKVVFINTDIVTIANFRPGLTNPKKNDVCTIGGFFDFGGDIYLFIVEHGKNQVFNWGAFRPVDTRPTDISVFTGMLKRTGTKTPEPA